MLLLDNCEHLLGACSALAEALLGRCPHVHILATSRQPLGIPAEVVQPVLPLDVPPVDAPEEHLLDYAAGQLFLERARSAAPHLRLGQRMRATLGRSVANWKACRWRWSWPPRACAAWRPWTWQRISTRR